MYETSFSNFSQFGTVSSARLDSTHYGNVVVADPGSHYANASDLDEFNRAAEAAVANNEI